MSDKPFTAGDTVALNSGGPGMTVQWCEEEYGAMRVYCVWFDEKNTHQQNKFVPESLKKIDV